MLYYHGSPTKLSILEPRVSAFDNAKLLFLATRRDIALSFCGKKWTDADLATGTVNGKMYITELKEGALKSIYSGTYYLHIVFSPTELKSVIPQYRQGVRRT